MKFLKPSTGKQVPKSSRLIWLSHLYWSSGDLINSLLRQNFHYFQWEIFLQNGAESEPYFTPSHFFKVWVTLGIIHLLLTWSICSTNHHSIIITMYITRWLNTKNARQNLISIKQSHPWIEDAPKNLHICHKYSYVIITTPSVDIYFAIKSD